MGPASDHQVNSDPSTLIHYFRCCWIGSVLIWLLAYSHWVAWRSYCLAVHWPKTRIGLTVVSCYCCSIVIAIAIAMQNWKMNWVMAEMAMPVAETGFVGSYIHWLKLPPKQ
ncbi:hypothetical protein BTJ40_03395 [Microbulbifer sp. A4B17]|nr:hypothetical protein BTJ40_03395 [Microbulbifer sp. A4B17]